MSFEIARSGINAINAQLDTISNNIANTGTYGFKSSRTNFAAMYAGTQPNGVEASSLTQAIDIGGGVMTTGRGLDAMIQGRGFFVTRDHSGSMLYTRVGIFTADKDGYIIDSFGRNLQGYGVNGGGGGALGTIGDLRVPTGQITARASSFVEYVGNLSADWGVKAVAFDKDNPLSYNSSQVTALTDSLGVPHTLSQYFVKSGANEITMRYAHDGQSIPPNAVVVDSSPWTVITASDPTADLGAHPDVTITHIPGDPALSLPDTWKVDYAGAPVTLSDSAVIEFSSSGQILTINGVPIAPKPYPSSADWVRTVPAVALDLGVPASGALPMSIQVNYTGTTQYGGNSTVDTNRADGHASGTLAGVQIEEDGTVLGVYSNGRKQPVGTIVLATFANEGALQPVSDTAWTTSNESGAALYSAPGSEMAGKLKPGALEQSNVDVTSELVTLMSAQRNYQANTKIISAENEMMQTLMQAL